jgi:FkbM family methyltransferase
MLGTVNGRWGPCTYFLKDEYVGRSVRNYGEYNPDETEKVLSLANEAGVGLCLDIGANIGCISQALLSVGEKVLAVEPQPEVWKVLRENLDYVDSSASTTLCALGSVEGTATMPKIDYSAKANIGGCGIRTMNAWERKIEVHVTTLDRLVAQRGRVKFIKMDVEGFELEVLKGGRETILRDKPIMYIEDDRTEKSYALRKYIREELGYWIEEHKPTLYRPKNFLGLERNIWDLNYASHNIICRPC